ncbi:MAG: GNAT family N-acetyltransferase [Thermoleophilaceae bacterium]
MPPGHAFPESDVERWHARLDDPAVTMLAAAEDVEMLGFTACGESRDPDAGPQAGEVWTLFVAAGRWRGGVGRALMGATLADLAARGYAEATVWSFAANEPANAFYEAHGFARDGAERTEETWAHLLEVRYRRALA